MSNDDRKKFLNSAKALLRKISAHAKSGGEYNTHSKIELSFSASRDRLEDKLIPLGLNEDPYCLAALEQVKQAVRACPDAAFAARQARNEAEIRRIDDEIKERNSKLTTYEKEIRAGYASRTFTKF